jgi:hypothetical protein
MNASKRIFIFISDVDFNHPQIISVHKKTTEFFGTISSMDPVFGADFRGARFGSGCRIPSLEMDIAQLLL